MTITQNLDFLYNLFPDVQDDDYKLIEVVKRYYSVGPFEPKVNREGDQIHITLDVDRIEADKEKYANLVSLAENKKFDEAKSLANELIEDAPNISEYHRILGQIYSDTGEQDAAIDALIDALRWNPKNEWALIMMGNIYARYKKDVDTAMTFYNEVLAIKPDDHLTLNNIAVQLMESGNLEQAKATFEKAHKANPDYPNTLHALAMIAHRKSDNRYAFDNALQAIRKNPNRDELYHHSISLALTAAKALIEETDVQPVIDQFIKELEERTGTPIRKETDPNLPTAATIQYAEVYNRNHHLVKYKPNHPAGDHLVMHELVHLELREEARSDAKNKLFITHESYKAAFLNRFKKDVEKLKRRGVPEENVRKYLESLHEGINRQVFNTPIDLFIEDRIYDRHKELHPYQFRSLYANIMEGADAVTKKETIKSSPGKILSNSVVYSLINALHFKTLYGVDLLADHNPKRMELEYANKFYEEYQEYREDKQTGEEYELIEYWADDLNLSSFFELVDEGEIDRKTAESVLDDIERDPYGQESSDPLEDRQMKKFIEAHADKDTNQAVVMYMVSALQYFDEMPKEEIKTIAMDIAKVGMTGIDPKKKNYHIPSIPDSSFSGYKALAYYYVSWSLAIPHMVKELGLPFEKEFMLAKQVVDDSFNNNNY
ncbi:MAG: tetratricopeptide repeat protein [Balneolaceae bacterium]|nr:tetratricopeptide repeat protein [Balneolaceae bacterium]